MCLDESVYHCNLDQGVVQPKKNRKENVEGKIEDSRYHDDLCRFMAPFMMSNLFPCCIDHPFLLLCTVFHVITGR